MAASVVLDILSSIIGYMILASINRRRAAELERACADFSSSSDHEQDFDGTGGVMTVHYTQEQTDIDQSGQKTQAYLEFRSVGPAPTPHQDDDNNVKNPFLANGGTP
jgi:hypothetical protein